MDKRDGKLLQTFKNEQFVNDNYRIRSTLAAGDGLVVSGGEDGQVFVWDVLTGHLKQQLSHKQSIIMDGRAEQQAMQKSTKKDVISAVAWNQLRKELATAGGDGTVVIWCT